jgi:hypothetical protein
VTARGAAYGANYDDASACNCCVRNDGAWTPGSGRRRTRPAGAVSERGARARSPARKATLNSQRALETLVHRDRQKRAERRRRLDRTQAGCRSTQQKPSTHEPVLHTRQPLTLQSAPASGSQARRFPLLHTLRKRCSIRGERSVDRCRTSSAGGGVDAGISAAHLYTVMRSVSLHPMTGD